MDTSIGRRPFLAATAAILGSWAVPASFRALAAERGVRRRDIVLQPVADETTGLPLLQLPEGFRYLSTGWTKDPLADGTPTPDSHDGMAVIAERDGVVTLCRNHECSGTGGAFGPREKSYDVRAEGGCTNLTFDTRRGKWGSATTSLSGTLKNCAGGPTPWGTWLSCEETVLQGGDEAKGKVYELEQPHGYIFEVPAVGIAAPVPLKAMGRFVHEAVAVDPVTGCVYETEDRPKAGFYRFTPRKPGVLANGGRLEMMKVRGNPDLIEAADPNRVYEVSWVPIEDPDRAHSPGTQDQAGVMSQGLAQQATVFSGLEGCWWGDDVCYFISKSGGKQGTGQVWRYQPRDETLHLILESPGPHVLDNPDNVTVSPRGGLVICEDGDRSPQKLQTLSPAGVLTELAWNNLVLDGQRHGFQGDFRAEEWAGATFSPDGMWLFANLQVPGITVAITGPWESVGV